MNITTEIIQNVVDNDRIFVEFQPIYSLNTKKIIGLEALARGEYDGEVISPFFLFDYAKKKNSLLEVDRKCREKAMGAFSADNNTVPTLFVNFESSVLNEMKYHEIYDEILKTSVAYNIPCENIVIEINENKVKDTYNLLMFINYYRSHKFLIALDNVSSSPDTINKIMMINPDIIKIDKAIINNIESNEYNQEVFKSIIQTAKRIGAMTVAEGAESVDEVITCTLMGVDYFQGFFFSRPEQFNYLFTNEARLKLEDAAQKLNLSIKNNPTVANIQIETYKNLINEIVSKLVNTEPQNYNIELNKFISEHNEVECVFLIDENGFQITDTILSPTTIIESGYFPAVYGENHDIKNYFYAVKEQIEDPFISGWYKSSATGKSCKTISSHFYTNDNQFIVVSIDLKKRKS